MTESAIQRQILAYLRARRIWAWRNNSGRLRGVRFGVPGMPDITAVLRDGTVVWIECKSATGKLSGDQTEWMAMALRHGHRHVVARTVEDVVEAIR